MIPKITAGGSSFKGACRYYLHDKGADTTERVAWTHTENLLTDDPDKAWRVMAWTAMEQESLKRSSGQKLTGRKLTKPVFAYSLSWHEEQNPEPAHMLATAQKSLAALGYSENQTLIVAHRDTGHKHLHIIVNRVHPASGIAADDSNSRLKLSDFALNYEREFGKVYCKQREANHAKRQNGEKVKYRDPVIENAWLRSDSGAAFAAALQENGYRVGQGRKRIVVVDRYGQTHNPTRHLNAVRSQDFLARLKDINLSALPDATKLAKQISEENMRRYRASLAHDRWASEKLATTQNKHIEQRAEISNKFHDKKSDLLDELNQFYAFDERRKAIDALEKTTAKPGLWRKITGMTQRDKQQLENLKRSYQNAAWRAVEATGKVEQERLTELHKLYSKQNADKKMDLQNIDHKKPVDYADEAERKKILELSPTNVKAHNYRRPGIRR